MSDGQWLEAFGVCGAGIAVALVFMFITGGGW